ncbi:YfiR family protein [Noviherbaspirillum sp. 1P10PC]|uniref:YfiR family protein n=1 Tax=Noviherbaspirillum sp. 1P10PC TaxID=3132292 RepID=UPI0039A3625B
MIGALPFRPVIAQVANEYAAKAAFLYNVMLFSSFPVGGNGTIRLCVLGRDPFSGGLNMLEGKEINSSKLTIAYPRTSTEAFKQCQAVFVALSEADNILALATLGKESGVMTISDVEGSARKGIMVELHIENNKIAFEFNNDSAHSARISLSSKVIRLAKSVY